MSRPYEERLQARELRRQQLLEELRGLSRDRAQLSELTGASIGKIRRAVQQERYLRAADQPSHVVLDEGAWLRNARALSTPDAADSRAMKRAKDRREGLLKPRRFKSGLSPRRSPMRFAKLAKAGTLRKELQS